MVQQARYLRLALEPRQILVLVGLGPHGLQLHQLDGHLALDPGILGQHDASHGARTQETQHLVAADHSREVEVVEVTHVSILPNPSDMKRWFVRILVVFPTNCVRIKEAR